MPNPSDSTAKPNAKSAADAAQAASTQPDGTSAGRSEAPQDAAVSESSATAASTQPEAGDVPAATAKTPPSPASGNAAADSEQAPVPSTPDAPQPAATKQAASPPAPPARVAPQPTATAPTKPAEENPWIETVKTIGVSVVLALGLRAAIVEARYIPSGSMLPTLEINDRLIVEKVSYHFNDPQRGDIVVFSPTDRLRQDNPSLRDAFIKRIIGLPGETVEITNGQVLINGEPIEENYIPEEYAPDYEWGPAVVPDGEYLVLGDNRNNSYDSHFWGYVPERNIIGRAVIRFWPPQRMGTIDPIPVYLEESEPAPETTTPAEGATAPQG